MPVTFLLDGITAEHIGQVCKISASNTVSLCDAEDVFYGRVGQVDLDGSAGAIERSGFIEVSYTGDAPTPGYVELVADGAGGVKTPTTAGTGRMYDVVSVDTDDATLFIDLK